MTVTAALPCVSGAIYDYNVTITYNTPNNAITGLKEYGTKNLIGKCT
ncbi:MAG: hypothetical protein NTX79_07965 [Candidatus Micrarchaeota archaeon]|nr:hypothetical protein [Candidatus Micrarchaeota archaeon]